MKETCKPFYSIGGSTPFYIPMDNGRLLGSSGPDGNPCSFKPNVSTSTSYFSGVSIREINIPDTSAPARKEFLDSLTQLQPYVGRDFVPYTIPSQPFVEPYVPYAVPNPSEVTKKTDPVITNKQYVDKSIALRQSGDYENALKSCDEALKADPKYLDGWNEKAAVFINKGQYEKAIECCDKAIAIDPKYFVAYINKAIASRILGNYENALKSCDEALKINPQYTDGQNEKNNIKNSFFYKKFV